MEERGGRIDGRHKVLADEKGIEAGAAKFQQVGVRTKARFGHRRAIVGNVLDEFKGGFPAHRKGLEVTIIDAKDACASAESAIQFRVRVNFDEGLHLKFAAECDQITQQRVVQSRDNKQEAIGVIRARFPNLPGVKNEVLAERGQADLHASIAQILEGATEEFAFGEHRKGRRAGRFERLRKRRSIKRIAEDSSRWRSGLELGNYVDSIPGKRGAKIPYRRGGFDPIFEGRFRQDAFAAIDFSAAGFQNAVQDGAGVGMSAHGVELVC